MADLINICDRLNHQTCEEAVEMALKMVGDKKHVIVIMYREFDAEYADYEFTTGGGPDQATVLWHLEQAKAALMEGRWIGEDE